jgi:hypothetical protein
MPEHARRYDGEPSLGKVAAAVGLGVSGTVGYWVAVAIATGRPWGWFEVEERGWGTHFDGGVSTAHFVWSTVAHPVAAPVVAIVVTVILLAVPTVIVFTGTASLDLPYAAIAALTYVSVVASPNFWHSRPRLLLAGAILVVPLARRASTVRLAYLLPSLAVGLGLSAWFGAYLVTRWRYAI